MTERSDRLSVAVGHGAYDRRVRRGAAPVTRCTHPGGHGIPEDWVPKPWFGLALMRALWPPAG